MSKWETSSKKSIEEGQYGYEGISYGGEIWNNGRNSSNDDNLDELDRLAEETQRLLDSMQFDDVEEDDMDDDYEIHSMKDLLRDGLFDFDTLDETEKIHRNLEGITNRDDTLDEEKTKEVLATELVNQEENNVKNEIDDLKNNLGRIFG